ncbi:MAG: Rieske (2Fe-2S) protein [Mycobacterium sp.]
MVAATLSACTTYGKPPAETAVSSAEPAAPGAPANVVAATADVPVGSGVIVGDVVLTQPSAGVFKGFSTTCTHAGCTIAAVANGTINCPCHGSKFNLDGSVANGPAARPLESKEVSVEGDSIVLR